MSWRLQRRTIDVASTQEPIVGDGDMERAATTTAGKRKLVYTVGLDAVAEHIYGPASTPDSDKYNGEDIEKNMYEDAEKIATVTVTKDGHGLYMNGLVGPRHRIEPLPLAERSEDGAVAHAIYEIEYAERLDRTIRLEAKGNQIALHSYEEWSETYASLYSLNKDYLYDQDVTCTESPMENPVKDRIIETTCKIRCIFYKFAKVGSNGETSYAKRWLYQEANALDYTMCGSDTMKVCIQGKCVMKPAGAQPLGK
ncbi:hypothetical protein HPB50_022427 [Hyalomma asiaticum]|uniref:Uncharacterized protein n=1 Tax=Hyalomma asiaticum TaxID=266040 RepID=A0ACB7RR84_HYAAI|nr:hypothetical protein HPB50_022427 [Hyalomma asiaticum]